MMQVQMTIRIEPGLCQHQLDILAREDATDEERAIAQAVESYMLLVMEQIAQEAGGAMEYIGPQHDTAPSSTDVLAETRQDTARTSQEPFCEAEGADRLA